jgi:GH35 family endo-1,4-beta-xylanase
MKHTKKTLGTMLLSVAVLTSCADMDPLGFNAFEKPANIEGMEYLADYDALKEYKSANSSVSPDFKLGMALSANDYNANGMWTRLANANFDEVVAGNEMKMASIVNDQGKMDFGTVSAFVTNAETNGMNVYGHTLAWHAQQPVKWLNTILADKEIKVDPGVLVPVEDAKFDFADYTSYPFYNVALGDHHFSDGCLVIDPMAPTGANWERQYFVADWFSLKEGTSYIVTARIKGSEPGYADVVLGTWGASANGKIEFTDEWQEVTTTIKAAGDANADAHAMFQTGLYTGTIYIDWVTVSHGEAPAVEIAVPIIANGDAEGDDVTNVYSAECQKKGNSGCNIAEGVGYNGSRGFVVDGSNNPSAAQNWDTQFFVYANEPLKVGDKIHFSFKYRADVAAGSECQTHHAPGAYIHWNAGNGLAVNFTNEWQTYDKTFEITDGMLASDPPSQDMQSFAWNLAVSRDANKYYFDDIVMEKLIAANTIPLTPEERKDTLTWAMEQWVAGMMDACGGKVKAWDVVNEAISGGNPDAEGVYALQHSTEETVNDFFWQDANNLGDLDYVRTVVKFARQYGPEDIKLFVNDYNLESDWDNNQKLKSLIKWIERWEADGVTKIDGIGTQMHLSYYSDPNVQASKEKHITEMFKLLAASGKLVRVSELDIEFKDEQGVNVKVEDMTDAQLRKVSDFYKWIIQQYIANVPAAQQYGFCIWTAVDADPSTSWTHNQLYGLWNKNFNRTHAYAGFADGLGGK